MTECHFGRKDFQFSLNQQQIFGIKASNFSLSEVSLAVKLFTAKDSA